MTDVNRAGSEAPEASHHVAAGVAYLALAVVVVISMLTQGPRSAQPGALVATADLGFLAACALYRARFGSDSLPDRIERARRAVTYATGLVVTFGLLVLVVAGIGKLL